MARLFAWRILTSMIYTLRILLVGGVWLIWFPFVTDLTLKSLTNQPIDLRNFVSITFEGQVITTSTIIFALCLVLLKEYIVLNAQEEQLMNNDDAVVQPVAQPVVIPAPPVVIPAPPAAIPAPLPLPAPPAVMQLPPNWETSADRFNRRQAVEEAATMRRHSSERKQEATWADAAPSNETSKPAEELEGRHRTSFYNKSRENDVSSDAGPSSSRSVAERQQTPGPSGERPVAHAYGLRSRTRGHLPLTLDEIHNTPSSGKVSYLDQRFPPSESMASGGSVSAASERSKSAATNDDHASWETEDDEPVPLLADDHAVAPVRGLNDAPQGEQPDFPGEVMEDLNININVGIEDGVFQAEINANGDVNVLLELVGLAGPVYNIFRNVFLAHVIFAIVLCMIVVLPGNLGHLVYHFTNQYYLPMFENFMVSANELLVRYSDPIIEPVVDFTMKYFSDFAYLLNLANVTASTNTSSLPLLSANISTTAFTSLFNFKINGMEESQLMSAWDYAIFAGIGWFAIMLVSLVWAIQSGIADHVYFRTTVRLLESATEHTLKTVKVTVANVSSCSL
jgi:hypothetical protein